MRIQPAPKRRASVLYKREHDGFWKGYHQGNREYNERGAETSPENLRRSGIQALQSELAFLQRQLEEETHAEAVARIRRFHDFLGWWLSTPAASPPVTSDGSKADP